ncbi:hypothetical protein [Helicobacter pylori]|uniref:hypothetical protein n=1 Tax=Helicobacter pylori TaxID=210 RepID=UPI001F08EBD1|nr:hypothetical protein [Helicobacter pylori]
MIVLRNASKLVKRARIFAQASDNLTACKRPKTQGQTHFYKQTLEFLEKMVAKHLSLRKFKKSFSCNLRQSFLQQTQNNQS